MARLRIGKQLEKSVSAGSLITTDSSNEASFLSPGTNGQLLTIVSGVPAWQTLSFPSEYEQYANIASLPITGSADVIYLAVAENKFLIWNGSSYVTVPSNLSLSLAGDTGTNQTITNGDTITIKGASSSGIITSGEATDTISISLREVKETFSPLTGATTVTASQTPILSTLQVYRNGVIQDITDDYTVSGVTITFLIAMGSSTGAAYSEKIKLIYRY